MANEILGSKSYLMLKTESTWGTNPDTQSGSAVSGTGSDGNWVHLPVDEFGVRFRPENRQAQPFLGIRQRKHSKNFRGMPSGTIRGALYGWSPDGINVSLAEYLFDWLLESPESDGLPSKTAIWAEGPDVANSEYNGLRCGSVTLQGSDDTGFIEYSAELMGRYADPQGHAPTVPNNRHKAVDFEFQDASFQLGGSSVSVKSFNLSLDRGLQPHYFDSYTPQLLLPGDYAMSLQLVIAKNANTYDAIRRATTDTETTAQVNLQGLHNGSLGSGTSAKVQIDFDRVHYIDVDDDRARQNLNFQTLNFAVLKPDTANAAFRTTWTTP